MISLFIGNSNVKMVVESYKFFFSIWVISVYLKKRDYCCHLKMYNRVFMYYVIDDIFVPIDKINKIVITIRRMKSRNWKVFCIHIWYNFLKENCCVIYHIVYCIAQNLTEERLMLIRRNTTLLAQDIIWTSIQCFSNVMDVKNTLITTILLTQDIIWTLIQRLWIFMTSKQLYVLIKSC